MASRQPGHGSRSAEPTCCCTTTWTAGPRAAPTPSSPCRASAGRPGRRPATDARAGAGAAGGRARPGRPLRGAGPQRLEYLLLYVAASRAGVVLVPLNPRSAPAEWDLVVSDAAAMLLVCGAGFDGVRLPAMPVVGLDELFAPRPGPAAHPGTDRAAPPLHRRDDGAPQGRRRSPARRDVRDGADRGGPHGGRPGERALVVAPLSHAGRRLVGAGAAAWGASLVFAGQHRPCRARARARRAADRLRGAGAGGARTDGRRARGRRPRLPGAAAAAHRLGAGHRAHAAPGRRRCSAAPSCRATG